MVQPRASQALDRWLPAGPRLLTSNGRSALLAAFRALKVPEGGKVLLPSYLCDSVVAPVRAHGAMPVFYPVSTRLEPDVNAVKRILSKGETNLLVVIHYFGYPMMGAVELRRVAADFDIPVIEDCAHALYSRCNDQPLGSESGAAVFSFRKSLPIPEGGALVLSSKAGSLPESSVHWKWTELKGLLRETVYRLESGLGFSLRAQLLTKEGVLSLAYRRNNRISSRIEGGLGRISHHILGVVKPSEIVARRRRNFLYLSRALEELHTKVRPLYASLEPGICPLGLPVLVEDREIVRHALARQGIGVRMFWDVLPEELPLGNFPDSVFLRDRIMVLPVHQDIREYHLDHIVRTLKELWIRS